MIRGFAVLGTATPEKSCKQAADLHAQTAQLMHLNTFMACTISLSVVQSSGSLSPFPLNTQVCTGVVQATKQPWTQTE